MKILFVNAYFVPETIAFSHLEKDLIEGLVAAGHEIEVICPTPTRNVSDELYKRYKSIKNEKCYDGKVNVRRFIAPREGKNPLIRAFRYFWCSIREYQIGRDYKNIDAIFAVSTPPTQGLLAGKLSVKLKCPFIYSLQDIFPDSLVTTGFAKKGSLIWSIGSWIERKAYGYAKRIIVISESFKRNLLNKGVSEDKISLISNWVDIDKIKIVNREENKLISEFNIDPNKFLLVYAGNFGAAQGADIILKVAEQLLNEQKIRFVIFGGGAKFECAVQHVKEHKLTNVIINPLLSQERVPEVYSLGDVALITCKPGVGNSGMPSKMWNIMACSTPIIASFDMESDLAGVIEASKGGNCVEPGNETMLKNMILKYYEKWENGTPVLSQARNYVFENASNDVCVKKYIEVMKNA